VPKERKKIVQKNIKNHLTSINLYDIVLIQKGGFIWQESKYL
jgi:hypothetical protein